VSAGGWKEKGESYPAAEGDCEKSGSKELGYCAEGGAAMSRP
jgi:hypothetical protein